VNIRFLTALYILLIILTLNFSTFVLY